MMITVIALMAVIIGTSTAEEGVVGEHSNGVVTTPEEIGVAGMVEDSGDHLLAVKWKA